MVGGVLCGLALTYFQYCSQLFTVILEMDCPFFGGTASKEIEARQQVENTTFPLSNCLISISLTMHNQRREFHEPRACLRETCFHYSGTVESRETPAEYSPCKVGTQSLKSFVCSHSV
ncbi:hypothetical protein ACRRTK_002642 [Alexandromys fortis]